MDVEAEVGMAGPTEASRITSASNPVTVKLLLSRWLCANRECARLTFADRCLTAHLDPTNQKI